MDLESYTKRLWALWLALPTTALGYWLAWDRLPARIATHYGVSGSPDGWSSRGGTLGIGLGVLGFVLVVTTAAGYLVGYSRPDRARAALVVMYVVVGILWLVENGFVLSSLQ